MFPTHFLTTLVLGASLVLANPVPTAAPVSPCAAVHIIAARASTEAPGPGIIGAVVTEVQSRSKQTVSTANVSYPATLTNYPSSSAQGTAATKTMLVNQVNACPNQKIVLVGYSQGAHVIGDAVAGGGGGALGAVTAPVPTSVSDKVVAIVQMGDPRHVPFKSFDKGTALRSGLYARPSSLDYSASLASRINSFCDIGDTFCDSGLSTIVHLTYLDRYQDDAVNFILNRIGG